MHRWALLLLFGAGCGRIDVSYNSDPWLAPDLHTIFHSRLEGSVRNVFVAPASAGS